MGIFTDLFSAKPAQEAAAAKAQGFATGNTTAQTALDAGQTQATPLYGQAYAPFGSLINSTGQGATAYGNATGVNGQSGIDSATANFKSMPGYQGGLDTGVNQVLRTAAQRGDVGGGNTSADEIKFASDYDAGKYGNYVAGLAPYLGANQSAAAGGAAVLGAQAGATQATAGQKAQFGYNAATGTGQANADAALAPYTASQNFWSALMGVGKLGASAAGGGKAAGIAGASGSGTAASVAGGSADLGAGTGDLAYLAFA